MTTLSYLDANGGKKVPVQKKDHSKKGSPLVKTLAFVKTDYAAVIDYSALSTDRRLYLMNLKTGQVDRFFVAHGKNSGVLFGSKFSNIDMSKQSSLGLALAGDTYNGYHGRSLSLSGLEASNSLLASRDIVMHGADYVSEDFIGKFHRLGRSWGCPAVETSAINTLIAALQNGSVIYLYHPALMELMATNPTSQAWTNSNVLDDADFDLPGEEEDIQNKR